MSNVPFVATSAGAASAAPSGAFPIDLYGVDSGGSATPPAWGEITDKPATFPPTVGSTATTAKAGNYTPTSAEVSAGLKAKSQIAALAPIADTATATATDVATALNAVIAALKA